MTNLHWRSGLTASILKSLRRVLGFDRACTCIEKAGRRTICRTCGSPRHC